MSRHALDPFKQPLIDDENDDVSDSHQMAATVASKPPPREGMSVLGPTGLFLSSSTTWRHRLSLMFPSGPTRFAAIILSVLAIASLATWSGITIRSRWIDPHSHPPTSVSLESVANLPVAHGTLSFFHLSTWFNRTIPETLHSVTWNVSSIPIDSSPAYPFPPLYQTPNPIPDSRYMWHTFYLNDGFDITSLEQSELESLYICTESDGVELVPTTLCTIRDYPTLVKNRSPWPLSFKSSLSRFCVRTYMLLDTRAAFSLVRDVADGYSFMLGDLEFNEPAYSFSLISLEDTYGLYLKYEAGIVPDEPTNRALYADPITLPYNYQHDISTRLSRRVKLDGSEEWSTELAFEGMRQLQPRRVAQKFQQFYASRPDILASLQSDPNIELDPSSRNFTSQYYAETCLTPSSFMVQTVTETTSYGFIAFLSDLGGAINILTITMAFMFPFAHTLLKPRMFIGVWMAKKMGTMWRKLYCCCCCGGSKKKKNAAATTSSELSIVADHTQQ